MERIIEFTEFDLGYELGIRFYGKHTIRIRFPVRLNHRGALMHLLNFVASGVNQAPQKDRDQFFHQFLQRDAFPMSGDSPSIKKFFALLKETEEIQQ